MSCVFLSGPNLKGIGVLDCSFFGLQDVDGILHRWPAEGPSLKVPIFCDNVPVPATEARLTHLLVLADRSRLQRRVQYTILHSPQNSRASAVRATRTPPSSRLPAPVKELVSLALQV